MTNKNRNKNRNHEGQKMKTETWAEQVAGVGFDAIAGGALPDYVQAFDIKMNTSRDLRQLLSSLTPLFCLYDAENESVKIKYATLCADIEELSFDLRDTPRLHKGIKTRPKGMSAEAYMLMLSEFCHKTMGDADWSERTSCCWCTSCDLDGEGSTAGSKKYRLGVQAAKSAALAVLILATMKNNGISIDEMDCREKQAVFNSLVPMRR